ncbi:hypothetical protein COA17_11255 [Sphingomonas ginsenosidimutans]|uniref:ParB-like N-terminal domain-containing protein n=1 Tax=Sphingomonas ginsenosidimutans TaxID=862134 RepID=A0A2A4HYG1_9SPHN|nr:hypothetical protein COA17_11255 [Sphingomonas ginsenosidimutans]
MTSTKQKIRKQLTLDQIRLSPLNVRRTPREQEDTSALEELILQQGLRVPIEVHQMRGSKGTWGAFAGRRRYYAIGRLIERGDMAADAPVEVIDHVGYSDAELIEMSITENLPRVDMEDHELFAGVARAAALGHDVAQITQALGQPDEARVAKWIRLGRLAKPVFDAFVAKQIDIDQARAYAATEDNALQEAVFDRLGRFAPARQIRAALKIGDATSRRHLMFVGEAIYRAAGGRYELDLFAETADDRGRVVDEGLLEKLVEEKLATVRDQVRATCNRPDLRFIAEPPKHGGLVDSVLAVTPQKQGAHLKVGDGVVAHIDIDGAGEPVVSYWWESRKAKFGKDKPKEATPVSTGPIGNAIADPYQAKPRADAAIRREEGLSQDATFALRAMRKAILRAALVADAEAGGAEGLDYLVFAQARMLLDIRRPANVGMHAISTPHDVGVSFDAQELARGMTKDMPAHRALGDAIALITRQRWFTEPDVARGYSLYRAADEVMKRVTAALVAGMALERSLAADGYQMPIHDVVAHHVGADRDDQVRRRWWAPSVDFVDFFPKDQRAALADPFVDRATAANWPKLKSADLTTAVVAALTRDGSKGASWIHPLLRFTAPDAPAGAELKEAAE